MNRLSLYTQEFALDSSREDFLISEVSRMEMPKQEGEQTSTNMGIAMS